MTHDPRLPTVEEVMHGSPFDIIDSPWGHIERWRASTLATGTMGALAQVAAIVRNDAAELEQKTVAFDAKKASVLRTVNKLINFMSRVDALTTRVEALEAKRRADEEQQRHFEEEPLTLPRDIAEYQTLSPPRQIEDETPPQSGELHALPPSEVPEPSLEAEDEVGDLPNELEEPPDPVPAPQGSAYPQPVAISLNTE
jgi:hypothetical protein